LLFRLGIKKVAASERLAQWRADYHALEPKRDALAAELAEAYPAFVGKIADLLTRIAANDAEIARLHQGRPTGVARHLAGAELVARGLDGFTTAAPSIATELRLPAFEPGQRPAWPPPKPFNPSWFAPVPYNPRYSADWGLVQEEEARAQRERQEREEAERLAKALAGPGPHWWAGKRG